MQITVIGEDAKFCAKLQGFLSTHYHSVRREGGRDGALEYLEADPPHLLVLVGSSSCEKDIAFLKALRRSGALNQLPVLCVNPGLGSEAGIAFLDAGADDFIHRSFNPGVFLARIRTLLRRYRATEKPVSRDREVSLAAGSLLVNLITRQTFVAERPAALTRLEFDLLTHLLRHPQKVFSRQEILEVIWNYPQNVETRTLDKHVETLRRKLGEAGSLIQTVHGVGYKLASTDSVSR